MNPATQPGDGKSQTVPPKVLMVDDEANVLSSFRRTLGRKWDITTAEGGAAALETLRTKGPFAVLVTDMQMPNMNGVELLEKVQTIYKDVVCMMLTGNADQDTAAQAINRGHVFRFLNKPCSQEIMESALTVAVRQHELVTAERVLLSDTLSGTLRLLTEAMGYSHPGLTSLSANVRKNAQILGDAVGMGTDWRLSLSATLCLIGFSVMHNVSGEHMLKDQNLIECAECGSRLIRFIPRLQSICEVIRKQRERLLLPTTVPPSSNAECEVLCSQVVRLAVDVERIRRKTCSSVSVLGQLRSDPSPLGELLAAKVELLIRDIPMEVASGTTQWQTDKVAVRLLWEGMILEEDVLSTDGKVLLAKGYTLSTVSIERLKSYARSGLIGSDILVKWIATAVSQAA